MKATTCTVKNNKVKLDYLNITIHLNENLINIYRKALTGYKTLEQLEGNLATHHSHTISSIISVHKKTLRDLYPIKASLEKMLKNSIDCKCGEC